MQSQKTVLHLIYRFDIGGLEMVMVNLINALPTNEFKHIIISLTDVDPKMVATLNSKNIVVIALHKPPGNSLKIHYHLWRLFRHHQPDILHSYNIAALEYQFIAFLAGIPYRIHAEHGRDIHDLDGSNKKYQLLRRFINPFIHHWIPVSQELGTWLVDTVKIPKKKVNLIYNGIDLSRYQPILRVHNVFTVGTVGRMAVVKNQLSLIKAVELLLIRTPQIRQQIQLLIVGDGELFAQLNDYIHEHQLVDCVHLLGARNDIAEILKQFDLFVLPSLVEGIALTLLEAMASGLPVIATAVGGNPELIDPGINGLLVPSQNEQQLADSIASYINNPSLCQQQGNAARNKAVAIFSLQTMVENYKALYQLK